MSELSLDAIRRRLLKVIRDDAEVASQWELAGLLAEEMRPEIEALLRLHEGLPGRNLMYRPAGPALVYVHAAGDAITLVDLVPWDDEWDQRERVLLMALLEYSLDRLREVP